MDVTAWLLRGTPSDSPTMDEAALEELRALQSRAYGPGADIAGDPAALRRLNELEGRAQRHTAPPAPPESGATASVADADSQGTEPDRAPGSTFHESRHSEPTEGTGLKTSERVEPDSSESAPPEPPSRWSPRRVAALWVASLLVAILVAASVSWAVTREVQADPQQVAVLGTNPDQRLPTVFGVDPDGQRFADFYGLTVVALKGRGWMGGSADDFCLLLMESEKIERDSNSYSGEVYGGCGAGTFPASVQVSVTDDLPAELRDRFPEGSALRFVLGDGEVAVLSDAE